MNLQNQASQNDQQLNSQLIDFFNEGGCIRDLHDVSDETMEAIYTVAYNLYQSEKYHAG